MRAIIDSSFVYVFALLYACIEIEIEGPNGWCKNLPTAKNVIGHFSLYHIYMVVLALTIISGFIYFRESSCETESPARRCRRALSRFVFLATIFFLFQDFLWFVLNPAFTLANYSEMSIPWHSPWYAGMPWFNYVGLGLAAVALCISPERRALATSGAAALLLLGVTVILSPLYHRFYTALH